MPECLQEAVVWYYGQESVTLKFYLIHSAFCEDARETDAMRLKGTVKNCIVQVG